MTGPAPEEPRIRDRHKNPPRFPWLVPTIIAVAAVVVAGAIIATIALGIDWF